MLSRTMFVGAIPASASASLRFDQAVRNWATRSLGWSGAPSGPFEVCPERYSNRWAPVTSIPWLMLKAPSQSVGLISRRSIGPLRDDVPGTSDDAETTPTAVREWRPGFRTPGYLDDRMCRSGTGSANCRWVERASSAGPDDHALDSVDVGVAEPFGGFGQVESGDRKSTRLLQSRLQLV